jgi:hypothetical protein
MAAGHNLSLKAIAYQISANCLRLTRGLWADDLSTIACNSALFWVAIAKTSSRFISLYNISNDNNSEFFLIFINHINWIAGLHNKSVFYSNLFVV